MEEVEVQVMVRHSNLEGQAVFVTKQPRMIRTVQELHE